MLPLELALCHCGHAFPRESFYWLFLLRAPASGLSILINGGALCCILVIRIADFPHGNCPLREFPFPRELFGVISLGDMTKLEIIDRIVNPGIVAIIRADSSEQLIDAAAALYEGGVTGMEVTMTTPNALQVIADVHRKFGDKVLIGVGTILDTETARMAILAGAEFVVTPVTRPEIIRLCNRYSKPIASGAFTPTECLTAHESGSDFVKLFPADQVGPTYIKNILAPMPMLRVMPTGGVTVETAGSFIKAGCVALAAGSSLVSKDVLKNGDWKKLSATAAAFVAAIAAARKV